MQPPFQFTETAATDLLDKVVPIGTRRTSYTKTSSSG
jgi:hypothetical protein